MGYYSCKETSKAATCPKVKENDKLFSVSIIESIESSLNELKEFPRDILKNANIMANLLEVQTKLTDCVVEMGDNFEIVDGSYRYDEEEKKPTYRITMTGCMEKRLLERIKGDPKFKVDNDLIAEDENYPDTYRDHIAGILSTLIFNFIVDDGVEQAKQEVEKEIIKSKAVIDHLVEKTTPPKCPNYKFSVTDNNEAIRVLDEKEIKDSVIYYGNKDVKQGCSCKA